MTQHVLLPLGSGFATRDDCVQSWSRLIFFQEPLVLSMLEEILAFTQEKPELQGKPSLVSKPAEQFLTVLPHYSGFSVV